MLDYATLRQAGIQLLQKMTGGQWTDFNTHDPGITLLEQLCYALTDFGYRINYEIPDLLAEGGSDPYASLHPPAAILTTNPVTPLDLRRLVIDVNGVKNAWVVAATADSVPLFYLPATAELRLASQDLSAQPISLRGLYRILIEPSGEVDDTGVRAQVAQRLHKNRGLCEDFAEITVLKAQPVQVEATVEIAPVDDPVALLGQIRQKLAEEISPPVPFSTLAELIDAGVPVDQIFEGPRLDHGFLTSDVLDNATRRDNVHTSDLMHAIMSVPGVRAVSRIRISKGGAAEEWSLPIDEDKFARLDFAGLKITLRRAGKIVAAALPPPDAPPAAVPTLPTSGYLDPPTGRNRNASKYTSVQAHLPAIYGIGDLGLSDSVTSLRKAQARQLKAYLLFFDQLLANSFAQLAHAKDLFAYDSGVQTYFTQAIDQPALELDDVRVLDDGHRARLQDATETANSDDALERKNRFLNHLLARFAEPIGDHALPTTLLERAEQKQQLLQVYPRCSSARGTGFDSLEHDDNGRSGIEQRLLIDLNLDLPSGENLIALEHILLRPMAEDILYDAQGLQIDQGLPLLAAAMQPDPYSLQLSYIFPDGVGRFSKPEFKQFIEQTLRAVTPAHLTPYVFWMDATTWTAFQKAHKDWRWMRRKYLAGNVSVKLGNSSLPTQPIMAIELRAARDRVIDLLGIGQTYPLQDTAFTPESLTVDFDTPVLLDVSPTQTNVHYDLYDGANLANPAYPLDGTGKKAVITWSTIAVDHTFMLHAYKIDRPQRSVFLLQKAVVKIGLNHALAVTTPSVTVDNPIIDYGGHIEVKVKGAQAGVTYRLLDAAGREISTAPVIGDGVGISLFTVPLLEDVIISVRATRTFAASEGRPNLDIILDAKLSLAVRANPNVATVITGSPLIDFQGTATLAITGSQKSVVYNAYTRSLLDGDFLVSAPTDGSAFAIAVPNAATVNIPKPPYAASWQVPLGYTLLAQSAGTDGVLNMPLGPLREDCVVVIQAHKDHSATVPLQSDLQLVQSAAILVRPDPVPGLTLQVTLSADGQSGSMLVSGGQPGVFYHFRRGSETTEIGLPAYFQKLDDTDSTVSLNRGVNLTLIQRDLVIARDPAPPADGSTPDLAHLGPVPPIVEITLLPQNNTINVMAVKARTGLSWLANRPFAVTTVPHTP